MKRRAVVQNQLGWETGFDFGQYGGGTRWHALVCYTRNTN
jgi:hypothetical protein